MLLKLNVKFVMKGTFGGKASMTTTFTRFPGALQVLDEQVTQVVVAGDPELAAVSQVVVTVICPEYGYPWPCTYDCLVIAHEELRGVVVAGEHVADGNCGVDFVHTIHQHICDVVVNGGLPGEFEAAHGAHGAPPRHAGALSLLSQDWARPCDVHAHAEHRPASAANVGPAS